MNNKVSRTRYKPNRQAQLVRAAVTSQAETFLSALGVKYQVAGNTFRAACPVHMGDNPSSWSWNRTTGRWSCYSHGCHEKYGYDAIGLVRGVMKKTAEEAMLWIVGILPTLEVVVLKPEERPVTIYPETCLAKLLRSDYYRSKGFSEETCAHFWHGEAQGGELRNRVVFPIRDELGRMIGFSGRWIGRQEIRDGKLVCLTGKSTIVPKWKHTSFPRRSMLFNLKNAKEQKSQEIIVVESIGNAMRWYDAGKRNVVATFGTYVSDEQFQLLMAWKTAILAFDGDEAGEKAARLSFKKMESLMDCAILTPPKDKDWADISNEEANQIYERTIRG